MGTTVVQEQAMAKAKYDEELAEKKRKEYEEWMRTQEMEAYRLEYDCSVKYEEHQQKQETSMQSSELSTNITTQQQQVEVQQMPKVESRPEPMPEPKPVA